MPNRRSVLGLAAALPIFLAARPALAREPEVFSEGGVAIGGTDPVAYFTDGGPVLGSAAHGLNWRGAQWLFASAENRALFEADPERYAPAYGGYCAWAMSEGYLAPTIPEAWTIYEERLYLNANLRIRRRWERDIPGHIARADANWPGVLG